MDRTQGNPFRPGFGKVPPLRAGRNLIAAELRSALTQMLNGEDGDCIVLYGPRGNGKTVLLEEVRVQAKDAGADVREMDSDVFLGGVDATVAILSEGGDLPGETTTTVEGGVPGMAKGVIRLSSLPHYRVGASLLALAENSPVVLLVDEAHMIPPELGRSVLAGVQMCIRRRLPLLAVLAGTPGLPEHFRKLGATFWERTTKLRIGRLESDESAREALAVPALRSGMPIDEDALNLLVEESQRYPFFVQMAGRASWSAAQGRAGDPRRITLADARSGIQAMKDTRTRFYEGRREEILSHGILREAEEVSRAMLGKEDGILSRQELKKILVSAHGNRKRTPKEVKDGLVALGLIWDAEAGKWEAGIPSLCHYLVENADPDPSGDDSL